VAALPGAAGPAAHTVDTLRVLSAGRLALVGPSDLPSAPGTAAIPLFRPGAEEGVFLRNGETDEAEDVQLWVAVPGPRNRDHWQESVEAAAERGAYGILAPAGSRLLDVLRNPKRPGPRHDLRTAIG
jgi:hypothetical protein